ncbi:MAG: hypothetical protein HOJ34_02440 [Kordiimonadaceae bacterium]|jgi:hypothetical protein|nr:hypothetical protein [Kordiimonadaceae bacterium]MBT6033748.1 hypothetical protein [Kordiimonadaceae bacterium]MBT6328617.1 hypothetical protein [Kordiimonadaceae bacterium]
MTSKSFKAQFELNRSADELFPLFSAEGETLWVPGWDYIAVSAGKELHEDYVFLTENHDYATTNAIWLVKKHEPDNYFVQFYKVEPEDKIAVVSVKCEVVSKSRTQVTVGYEYIALSDKGRDFISDHSDEDYVAFIGEWKILLEMYFEDKD